jgi:hypothetical protein
MPTVEIAESPATIPANPPWGFDDFEVDVIIYSAKNPIEINC